MEHQPRFWNKNVISWCHFYQSIFSSTKYRALVSFSNNLMPPSGGWVYHQCIIWNSIPKTSDEQKQKKRFCLKYVLFLILEKCPNSQAKIVEKHSVVVMHALNRIVETLSSSHTDRGLFFAWSPDGCRIGTYAKRTLKEFRGFMN